MRPKKFQKRLGPKVDGGILMGQHSDVNSFKKLAIAERDMRSLTCYLISDVKLY